MTEPLAAAAVQRGSSDFLAIWAGQAALARETPAAELVARIVTDARRVLAELAE